jgi:hypothetical protein
MTPRIAVLMALALLLGCAVFPSSPPPQDRHSGGYQFAPVDPADQHP